MADSTNPTQGRPEIDSVEKVKSPFPIVLNAEVIKGFGRGSKELGIPTANYPQDYVDSAELVGLETGIYYGYSQVLPKADNNSASLEGLNTILPMVMSLGWNPYYKNEKRSAEVHVIHDFKEDFYGHSMKTVVLGYIRPERSYDSLDGLIADIRFDIEFAKRSLQRPGYKHDDFSSHF